MFVPVRRGPGTLVNPWFDKFLIFKPSSVSLGSFISTVFFFLIAASFVPFPSKSDFLSFGVEVLIVFGLADLLLFVSDFPDSGLFSDFPDSGLFGDFPDSGLFGDLPDLGLVGDPLADPFLVGEGDCFRGDLALGDPGLLPDWLLVGLWKVKKGILIFLV